MSEVKTPRIGGNPISEASANPYGSAINAATKTTCGIATEAGPCVFPNRLGPRQETSLLNHYRAVHFSDGGDNVFQIALGPLPADGQLGRAVEDVLSFAGSIRRRNGSPFLSAN